jgi:dienelactone hydrolase
MRRLIPHVERCEDRCLTTLIFVLNGNGFAAATPNQLTANAAAVLRQAGNQVVQLSNAAINTPAAYNALARKVVKLAHGQAIGLVGFSAGGALALRLAATPGLKVNAVLDYYGVPDIRAYLQRHSVDHNLRPISGLAPFRPPLVALLSGPIATSASVIAAFGAGDPNVRPDASSVDLLRDDPSAHIYTYPAGHGVSITASRPALAGFLRDLP